MDRERVIKILEEYGVGPNILPLIVGFWHLAVLVCRAASFYGSPFKAYPGVTQGGPLSPRIFNIMVDAIVREWLRQVMGDSVAQDGIGAAVALLLALFYTDDGMVASTFSWSSLNEWV